MQLVLIDNRIKDVETVISSLLNNVEFVMVDYENDTYDSLISKIPSKVYNSVGIFQENYELNTYQLIKSFSNSLLINVSSDDPNLATWSQYKNLLAYFKNTLHIETLDLMGCRIKSSLDWKYVIKCLEDELNININCSRVSIVELGKTICERLGLGPKRSICLLVSTSTLQPEPIATIGSLNPLG